MIITKKEYKTSSWSGGTTTELFIYPPESTYQERNFQIRISSATVDVDESNFTKLPDYNRVLMILSGELEINHQNHHSKTLSQYGCDYFDGAWDTSAKGKVRDFNLMTSESFLGKLVYDSLSSATKYTLKLSPMQFLEGLYLISGKLLNLNNKQVITKGNLIILQNRDDMYELQALEECKIIQIYVL